MVNKNGSEISSKYKLLCRKNIIVQEKSPPLKTIVVIDLRCASMMCDLLMFPTLKRR